MSKKVIFTISLLLSSLFLLPGLQAQDPFLGEIKIHAGDVVPRGWLPCDGRELPIASYRALFSIIGATYGGDGTTTFALPDLRGRAAMGMGQGAGLTNRRIGEKSGKEGTSLTFSNLPLLEVPAYDLNPAEKDAKHHFVHGSKSFISVGNTSTTVVPAAIQMRAVSGELNQPVDVMQPSLVVNYMIAVVGLYPSRN